MLDIVEVNKAILDGYGVVQVQRDRLKRKENIEKRLEVLRGEIRELDEEYGVLTRTTGVLSALSDEVVGKTLSRICSVLNRALRLIFPTEEIVISIKKEMYRNLYPHFMVSLNNGGNIQTFNQNGDGLAQVISLLFTLLLVDIRKGRKFVVFDECMRGLHPLAKSLVLDIISSMSDRFQFIVIEHGINIGEQYEVFGTGLVSNIRKVEGDYFLK